MRLKKLSLFEFNCIKIVQFLILDTIISLQYSKCKLTHTYSHLLSSFVNRQFMFENRIEKKIVRSSFRANCTDIIVVIPFYNFQHFVSINQFLSQYKKKWMLLMLILASYVLKTMWEFVAKNCFKISWKSK